MFGYAFVLVSVFGAILAAYPPNLYQVSNLQSNPGSNQQQQQQQQLPPYLISPKGVYVLFNSTNATADSSRVSDHDFVFGVRGPRDHLLLRTVIYKRPRFWSYYVTKEITFPPPRSSLRVNITQVIGHDRGFNRTGGFLKIIGGGIGTGNVTLLFTSHRNLGINFGLEIYGTKK